MVTPELLDELLAAAQRECPDFTLVVEPDADPARVRLLVTDVGYVPFTRAGLDYRNRLLTTAPELADERLDIGNNLLLKAFYHPHFGAEVRHLTHTAYAVLDPLGLTPVVEARFPAHLFARG